MPNWCENELSVYGEKDDLGKFIEENKTKTQNLSFAKAIPESGNCEENINNWGTKWDIDEECTLDETDKERHYFFLSAWTPPEPWLKKVIEMYPTLRFEMRYWEHGNGFIGLTIGEKGKIVSEECNDNWDGGGGE